MSFAFAPDSLVQHDSMLSWIVRGRRVEKRNEQKKCCNVYHSSSTWYSLYDNLSVDVRTLFYTWRGLKILPTTFFAISISHVNNQQNRHLCWIFALQNPIVIQMVIALVHEHSPDTDIYFWVRLWTRVCKFHRPRQAPKKRESPIRMLTFRGSLKVNVIKRLSHPISLFVSSLSIIRCRPFLMA